MSWLEAMTILGLAYSDLQDLVAIRGAWKLRLRKCHPDKNQLTTGDATMQTQHVNEAKDVLVARVEENDNDAIWREEMATRSRDLERLREFLQRERERLSRELSEGIRLAKERRAQAEKEREDAFKRPFERMWLNNCRKKARSKQGVSLQPGGLVKEQAIS
jgi:hypothetical protein